MGTNPRFMWVALLVLAATTLFAGCGRIGRKPAGQMSEIAVFQNSIDESCQSSGYARSIIGFASKRQRVSLFSPNLCPQGDRQAGLLLNGPVVAPGVAQPQNRPIFVLIDVMGSSPYDTNAIPQTRMQQTLQGAGFGVHRVIYDGTDPDQLAQQLQLIGRNVPPGTQLITSISGHGSEFNDLANPANVASVVGNAAAGGLPGAAQVGGLEQGHVLSTSNVQPLAVGQLVAGLMAPPTIASAATTVGTVHPGNGQIGTLETSNAMWTRGIAQTVAANLPQSANSLVIIDSCNAGAGVGNFNGITGTNGQPINVIGAVQNNQYSTGAFAENLAAAYAGDRVAADNLRRIAGGNGQLSLSDLQNMALPPTNMPATVVGQHVLSDDPIYANGDNSEDVWGVDFSRLVNDDGSGPRIMVPQNPIVLGGNQDLVLMNLGGGPNPQVRPGPGPGMEPGGVRPNGGADPGSIGTAVGPGADTGVSPGEVRGPGFEEEMPEE